MEDFLKKKYSVCRICLEDDDDNVSLFDESSLKYLQMIKTHVGLDLLKNDMLPSRICSTCVSELGVVDQFVSKCKTSQEKLGRILLVVDIKQEECNDASEMLDQGEIKIEYNTDAKYEDLEEHDIFANEQDGNDPSFHDQSSGDERVVLSVKRMKRKYVKSERYPKKVQKKEHVCETCNVKLSTKHSLLSHMRKHTGEKPYVCDVCNASFSQSSTLAEHRGRVHDKNGYKARKRCVMCDHCGKICYRKSELTTHMRVHTKEKPYACNICNTRFTQKATLVPHMRRHEGKRPYSCHICGATFVTSFALKTHMNVHSDEKKYNCHVCNKKMKSTGSLKLHLKLHVEAKPYVCDKCGGRYSQKVNLRQHILTQHSDRSGFCDICKKNYADFNAHNRVHNGEKPFKCTHCERAFANNAHLTKHLKRIREATKYQCTTCEAAFPMQCQLDYHTMKYHTKEFVYKCATCSQGFYRLTDKKRHENRNPSCKVYTVIKPVDDKANDQK